MWRYRARIRSPAFPGAGLGRALLLRFRLPASLVASALVYGTVGYWLILGVSWLDAVYMTVLTLSTVGLGGPQPLSSLAKLFTISLILFGVAALFAAIGVGTEMMVSGDVGRWVRWRRMVRRVERMREHFVVCAYGRVGRTVVEDLVGQGQSVVVIEPKSELAALLDEQGVVYVSGDATDEALLRRAGVEHARGLVCAVDSDASNVFITLTARALNPQLRIIARAADPASVDTLTRAGADEVISPYRLSGRRMAWLALHPSVLEVLDLLEIGPDVRLEEILVRAGSPLDGLTVAGALRRYVGMSILAVKKRDAALLINPDHTLPMEPGDLIVTLGPVAILDRMSR